MRAALFYSQDILTDRSFLGGIGKCLQELLRGLERSNITRDEDCFPTQVYDCGKAGSVRVAQRCFPLKLG